MGVSAQSMFQVRMNKGTYELEQIAFVEKGEIVKVTSFRTFFYENKQPSHIIYQPADKYYAMIVDHFIHNLYKEDKNTYDKFVNALNQEMLDKYFKKIYVPK